MHLQASGLIYVYHALQALVAGDRYQPYAGLKHSHLRGQVETPILDLILDWQYRGHRLFQNTLS
ncbi:hypothetical protein FC34_GL000115 [Lacticaseibacillus brantae DSM 23927]|uniref:Uncharacterized protein n=1 Tax=Lacticaseibacillus brantae DSM 23927 TaxID=1423727 RepID=A0A0R2B9Q4_9LACO|nr:hypothetical protein FC34_GL000115 [Lacticaseibacillus brantae DSM 23927]